MAKATQKDLFGNMTYAELRKFSQEHDAEWADSIPEWANEYWLALEKAAKKEFPNMTLNQLNEIWCTMEEGEFETTGDMCLDAMFLHEPIASVLEDIAELQKLVGKMQVTLEVLLKQRESEPSNITVAQLNRLKGGL